MIVGCCVLAAALFLLRRWFFSSKKSAVCGGCSGCDKTAASSCANPTEKIHH
ncbi:FeoB-associated Cys-rich membrane protein [Cellvibrio sp. KY-GH-1]|uniref:FeoB-associated Cys-rich membrane protein n=1 Tax=Cellvibrio sp. KY-GH-1 TaxID=2303332 RepID=UPI001CDA3B6E